MNDYCLVDCGFHDQLEALATLRQTCQISYRTDTEEIIEVQSQIVDVYAANKADFLKLKDGTEIRLDRLISVNGSPTRFAQE
jgi:Rho-binding antiterminator